MIKNFCPTQLVVVDDDGDRIFLMTLDEPGFVDLNLDAVLSLDEFEECVRAIRQGFKVLGTTIQVKEHD